jgi:hypothetical protein
MTNQDPNSAFFEVERNRQADFRSGLASSALRPSAGEPGYLLASGHEEENLIPSLRGPGGAIDFFRERGISWWRTSAYEDHTVRDRPTRHMVSSQVSCVNFLLPLASHPAALAALLRGIDGDVMDVVPIEHRGRTSSVDFEWIGTTDPLEPASFLRGEKRTSIDALLLARVPGGRRAYFIEWKYTEPCGAKSYAEGKKGATRVRRYQDAYDRSGVFEVPFARTLVDPAYQLVRSVLLGERSVQRGELGITEVRTVVVCPEANRAYRDLPSGHPLATNELTTVEELMRHRILRDPRRFAMFSQPHLVRAAQSERASMPGGWLAYQAERYGWA